MVRPFASLAGLAIVRSIQLKSSTVRPTASGWRATCSLSNASKASDISGCEGQARRGSILFRCERTYSCAVTLRAEINAAESCLTKQRWLLLLQPAKNREHIGLAALRCDLHHMLLRGGFVGGRPSRERTRRGSRR